MFLMVFNILILGRIPRGRYLAGFKIFGIFQNIKKTFRIFYGNWNNSSVLQNILRYFRILKPIL